MRTSRRLLKQVRRALIVGFVFSGCINALMLATPIFTMQVFETVVPTGSLETLALLTAMAGAAIFTQAVLELVRDRIMLRAGLWLDHTLGRHLLDNGLKAGLASRDMDGDIKALGTLRAFLTGPVINALFDAPWVPLFLAGLVLLNPMIGLVAVVAALMLIALAIVLSACTGHLQTETRTAAERSEQWWRTVAGRAQLAGALGLASGATERWDLTNREHIAGAYSLGKRTSLIKAIARAVRIGAQIGIYAVGAWLVIKGELAPGALAAAAILMAKALAPIEQSVSSLRVASGAYGAWKRLAAHAPDTAVPMVGSVERGPRGHLRLVDVAFIHRGRKAPSLRNISFSLEPGQSLAILGPNGAGKSTLAAIIAGAAAPHSGTAELDGLPIARWQRSDGPLPVGFLPDDAAVIPGTVHDNIARFRNASLMSVVQAAMKVGMHETLAALPQGYDTQIGAAGEGLSLRERRAVAFARAVFGAPRLVVLDEPELGLDGASIRNLIATLMELKREGTSLVIATQDQRLLALADRVLLMADGQMQSFGATNRVLHRNGDGRVVAMTPAAREQRVS